MTDDLPLSVSAAATDEARRVAVLHGLQLLDTPPEAEFDTIIACAQRLLGCKIALLSLVDGERQWFKAKAGLDAAETPRTHSFCSHAIRGDDLFVIPDARQDARFADNPLVRGAPAIRFYAGVPIRVDDPAAADAAFAVGTVCVIDDKPRALTAGDADILCKLGHLAEFSAKGEMLPYTANCYACHQQHAAADTTFVQFYPTLLPTATRLKTLNPAYLADPAGLAKE